MSQLLSGPAVAVIPVRDGRAGAGASEVAAEVADAGAHRVLLIGSAVTAAASELAGIVDAVELVEVGEFAPARWAEALRSELADAAFVLVPRSPDGRDLAPRLAAASDRPLHAGAVRVGRDTVVVIREGGLVQHEINVDAPFVATLEPGVRGVPAIGTGPPTIVSVELSLPLDEVRDGVVGGTGTGSVVTVEVLAPDPATIDLAEAPRIVGAGAGLLRDADPATATDRLETLRRVGLALGASMGATRVVTDAGHLPHERQIGTTGVVVAPDIYLAFGISGAVQHTAGLGHPDHVISVNVDAHCPMMALADIAIVADASLVIDQLAAQLGVTAAVAP